MSWARLTLTLIGRSIVNPAVGAALVRVGWRFRRRGWYRRPPFLPLPAEDAHIWDNLRLFAQFCFWGLWWPGVMIATVTMGRVWCGLFCPDFAIFGARYLQAGGAHAR